MKLTLTAAQIAKVVNIRSEVKRLRRLQRELELAAKKIPEVGKAVHVALDRQREFLPSEVLNDSAKVDAAWEELARAQFTIGLLNTAVDAVKGKFISLRGEINRLIQETVNDLNREIQAAFPQGFYTEAAARAMHALSNLNGEIPDRATELLKILSTLGIEIPEAKP